MAVKKQKKKKEVMETEMFSIRKDQHDRLLRLKASDHRSMRAILDRALDMYEGTGNG